MRTIRVAFVILYIHLAPMSAYFSCYFRFRGKEHIFLASLKRTVALFFISACAGRGSDRLTAQAGRFSLLSPGSLQINKPVLIGSPDTGQNSQKFILPVQIEKKNVILTRKFAQTAPFSHSGSMTTSPRIPGAHFSAAASPMRAWRGS